MLPLPVTTISVDWVIANVFNKNVSKYSFICLFVSTAIWRLGLIQWFLFHACSFCSRHLLCWHSVCFYDTNLFIWLNKGFCSSLLSLFCFLLFCVCCLMLLVPTFNWSLLEQAFFFLWFKKMNICFWWNEFLLRKLEHLHSQPSIHSITPDVNDLLAIKALSTVTPNFDYPLTYLCNTAGL